MGNCVPVEAKVVKVIKMDGDIVEYKAPVKVLQVLSEFKGLAIIDSVPFSKKRMNPCTELVSGHLYHLVPIQVPPPGKKKVRFSVPEVEGGKGNKEASAGLKVKLVITKDELKKMTKDGVLTMGRVISQLKRLEDADKCDCHRDGLLMPSLERVA